MDLLNGLRSYRGLIWWDGFPRIFTLPLPRRNYATSPPKVLLVQERVRGWARTSIATGAAKNVEFFVCLSVWPSRLGTSVIVRMDCRNDFDIVYSGRFVVEYPCSTFSDRHQYSVFTTRCTTVQSAVLLSLVVCPSVCLWRWWIMTT